VEWSLEGNLTETKTKTKTKKDSGSEAARPAEPGANTRGGDAVEPQAREDAGSPDFPPDAFERFWEAFPHKVGKAAAAASFRRMVELRKVRFAELMDGLARYVAAKPPDRSWLNPASFLDQERWQDEPAPPPRARSSIARAGQRPESRRPFQGHRQGHDNADHRSFDAKPLAAAIDELRRFAAAAPAPDLGDAGARDGKAGGDQGPGAGG
jgi:hypothetical protein